MMQLWSCGVDGPRVPVIPRLGDLHGTLARFTAFQQIVSRFSAGPDAHRFDRLVGHTAKAASLVAILLLSACADKPPIVSADTSCERFRHISATPAQIKVYQDNWEVMESYADQILAHNIEYDGKCLGVAP